jgi:hypothetical protein
MSSPSPPASSAPPNTAAPSPSPASPTPTPAPATGGGGWSTGAKVGVGVGVAVIVVVAIVLAGVIPGVHLFGSSGSGASTAGPSGTALPVAQTYASGHGSGQLYGVFGISVTTAFSATLQNLSGSCPVDNARNFTIPANSASYSSGSASGWVFVYWSSGTTTLSLIGVLGSTAYLLATYSGASCAGAIPFSQPLPSSFVSSAAAASTASAEGGSGFTGFLSAYSSANAEYTLAPTNDSSAPPVWHVYYTTCGIGPGLHSGVGVTADAFLDAASGSGALLSTDYTASISCSGGSNPIPGLGAAWFLSPSYAFSASDGAGYVVGLNLTPSFGLSTSEVGFLVANSSTGAAVTTNASPASCSVGVPAGPSTCQAPSAGWYGALCNATGVVLATYAGANAGWSSGPPIVLNATLVFLVISKALLHGNPYVLSPFGGTAGIVIGSVAT